MIGFLEIKYSLDGCEQDQPEAAVTFLRLSLAFIHSGRYLNRRLRSVGYPYDIGRTVESVAAFTQDLNWEGVGSHAALRSSSCMFGVLCEGRSHQRLPIHGRGFSRLNQLFKPGLSE